MPWTKHLFPFVYALHMDAWTRADRIQERMVGEHVLRYTHANKGMGVRADARLEQYHRAAIA